MEHGRVGTFAARKVMWLCILLGRPILDPILPRIGRSSDWCLSLSSHGYCCIMGRIVFRILECGVQICSGWSAPVTFATKVFMFDAILLSFTPFDVSQLNRSGSRGYGKAWCGILCSHSISGKVDSFTSDTLSIVDRLRSNVYRQVKWLNGATQKKWRGAKDAIWHRQQCCTESTFSKL